MLQRNQVPEWSDWYIAYKPLKKQIKTAALAIKAGKEEDFAEFFYSLDRNLETVDSFYNKRQAEFTRRFWLLESRYSLHPPQFDPDEAAELLTALLELRSSLRKLEWYAEVNRRGFTKILKKLDKKANVCTQRIYIDTKLSLKPFSSAEDVGALKAEVNAWISKLGEDNTALDPQGGGLKSQRLPSPGRSFWELPPSTVESIDHCLRDDDDKGLLELMQQPDVSRRITHKFELALLQRAISNKAPKCINLLLDKTDDLHEEDDINERNIIHRLVILIGKTGQQSTALPKNGISGLATSSGLGLKVPKDSNKIFVAPAQRPVQTPTGVTQEIDDLDSFSSSGAGDLIKLLKHVLEHLRRDTTQSNALTAKDTFGRIPLHYGAYYGIPSVCEILYQYMAKHAVLPSDNHLDAPFWQDTDGLAPLHLAVSNDHVKTARRILSIASSSGEQLLYRPAMVYALAINADAERTLEMLVESTVNLNAQDENGEAALHLAARRGKVNCLRILLRGSKAQKCEPEVAESTFGWTSLFVAAAEGNEEVVDILLATGRVDVDRFDSSGWTATEHAALRGHLGIAKKLKDRASLIPDHSKLSSTTASGATSPRLPSTPSSVDSQNGYFSNQLNGNSKGSKQQHLKSFGHRYLKDSTLILVTLGTTDTRKNLPAVTLDQVPLSHAHSTLLDSALSVAVSAQNAKGEKTIIDLPIQDNLATENPISFETADLTKVKLFFDIVPTYSGSTDKVIGRGVALLDTIKPNVSKQRVSLHGGVQVPILAVSTLDVIGCINFEFMVVTPFVHEGLCINREVTYWKELTGPKVIGHRGLGKNAPSRKSLQLGENTIQSFITAANLGASYVEFDVQLTKDLVPVIYHDFLVGETGIDAPVHALTLEQFLSMSGHNARQKAALPAINESNGAGKDDLSPRGVRRTRSMTFHDAGDNEQRLQERMRYTRNFKMKGGYKGNTRGSSIQGPFTTLEEVFDMLPAEVGFNIELKYPMLQESEEEDMETLVIEMNSWVDAVLKIVYDKLTTTKRDIIFSSFNPDVCLLLSFKQPSIPILFLTEAGTAKMADIRASCLQEAIRFASRWNLLGIVSAAEPFVLCPRLVRVVKESGLVCVTYGTMNNVTANVQLQVEQGVDAVIVDSVLEIRKGLTSAGVV